jgi:hypothetical protein
VTRRCRCPRGPYGINPLTAKPSHSSAQAADSFGLLLVRQNLLVGQSGGVIDQNVKTVVADANKATLLPLTGNAVPDFSEAGQLFEVDIVQVSGMLPLVALDWKFRVEIPQRPGTKEIEHPGHGAEGSGKQSGEVPEVEAVVP